MDSRSIRIVGGGLAGLTAGIFLARARVPVTVHEAGAYPRHRVCGEFISGPGQLALQQLGLKPQLTASGLRIARTAAMHFADGSSVKSELPQPAWCISRHTLDALLASEFQHSGGALIERSRIQDKPSEGTVVATGRRRSTTSGNAWRYVGVKVHATGIPLSSDLEMHCGPDGYFGLCQLDDQRVNVCALLRHRGAAPTLGNDWLARLQQIATGRTRELLRGATFLPETLCTTAGLDYTSVEIEPDTLSIGDAFGLIPPISGNGMSLAFETATMTAPFLKAYSAGDISWTECIQHSQTRMQQAFASRIEWARRLQKLTFAGGLPQRLLVTLAQWNPVWRFLYSRLRQGGEAFRPEALALDSSPKPEPLSVA